MKKLLILIQCFFLHHIVIAQGIALNETGTTPHGSAMLDVQSTAKGVLFPRMMVGQRTGIGSPAIGLLVYEHDTQSFWYRDSSAWVRILSGKSGWELTGNNSNAQAFMGTTNN